MEEPGKERQQRYQFVRVKRQDDALHPPFEVVAQECGRPKVTLLLEDQIVEDVIEIDQESTDRESGGQGHVSRTQIDGGTRHGRGHEMPAGAHVAPFSLRFDVFNPAPCARDRAPFQYATRNTGSRATGRTDHLVWGTTVGRGPAVSGKPRS